MSSNTLLAIIISVFIAGIAVSETAKNCRGGLTEKEARKMRNTVERLDFDMDKLKARKCKCQKLDASSN